MRILLIAIKKDKWLFIGGPVQFQYRFSTDSVQTQYRQNNRKMKKNNVWKQKQKKLL